MNQNVVSPVRLVPRVQCIFTICTKSYIGLAEALGLSLRDSGVDSDFLVLVVDHEVDDLTSSTGQVVSARTFCGYSESEWIERTFKYDLVELCTSIKARAFQKVFSNGYEKAIYFDPDIIVFDDLSGVFSALDTHDVVATPHRLSSHSDVQARGGVFNLGFLAARRGAAADMVMTWWDERLLDHAITDPMRGYFTDQKWMDHLPVLLRKDRLLISDHPGMNLAPWNLTEREMQEANGRREVRLKDSGSHWRPLCFAHFSAFDYRSLAAGESCAKSRLADDAMPGFGALLDDLAQYLRRGEFLKHAMIPYEYASFSKGTLVLPGHRRMYHRLLESGHTFPNPFEEGAPFHACLKSARLLTSAGMGKLGRPDTQERDNQVGRAAKLLDLFSWLAVRMIGYPRFALLCKLLIRYCHPSNQVRLLGKKVQKKVDFTYF
ncbi:hypothetical protein [Gemmobacter sp.]|uniref:hypothetical protein n=1 Tax=Gemmobacter sp. TaxID=1898957 RepID=UPI002AFF269D|nr:hypothetical protein [Gemmobacter sp.]